MKIREAILKAADHVETHPEQYNFLRYEVPAEGCTACMLGWIGKFLGLATGTDNNTVKKLIGGMDWRDFYAHVKKASGSWGFQDGGIQAAKCMRAYADKYHPAKEVTLPDWNAMASERTVPDDVQVSAHQVAL